MTDKPKTFKETYPKEKRLQIYQKNLEKNPNSVIVVVEKDPKCKQLPDLVHNRFTIVETQKIMDVLNAIRLRINKMDQKYANQNLFLFTNNTLPKKQYTIKEVYNTQKDPEDGLLYFKYSNVDPY